MWPVAKGIFVCKQKKSNWKIYDNLCAIKLCCASEVRLSIDFQEFCRNFPVNENEKHHMKDSF